MSVATVQAKGPRRQSAALGTVYFCVCILPSQYGLSRLPVTMLLRAAREKEGPRRKDDAWGSLSRNFLAGNPPPPYLFWICSF
jgi:hypothetical protein